MGDKGYFWISIIKSILRMLGFCLLLNPNISFGVAILIIAEILGILEEIVDKRGN